MTEHLIADARERIARYEPREAQERSLNGSVIVDLRSHDERARDGVIPGSVHVPRATSVSRMSNIPRTGPSWHARPVAPRRCTTCSSFPVSS